MMLRKTKKNVRIAGVLAEIRTEYDITRLFQHPVALVYQYMYIYSVSGATFIFFISLLAHQFLCVHSDKFRLIRHLQALVLAKIAALSFRSYPPTCPLSVVI
jgi:hypothetical protein